MLTFRKILAVAISTFFVVSCSRDSKNDSDKKSKKVAKAQPPGERQQGEQQPGGEQPAVPEVNGPWKRLSESEIGWVYINEEDGFATLVPRRLEFRFEIVPPFSANLAFIRESGISMRESCEKYRELFKLLRDELNSAEPYATAPMGTFALKSTIDMRAQLQRELRLRNVDYEIILTGGRISPLKTPDYSLLLHSGQALEFFVEPLENAVRFGKINMHLNGAQLCDLLSAQMIFGFQSDITETIIEMQIVE